MSVARSPSLGKLTCCQRIAHFFDYHADMVQQMSLAVCNTAILASKIFHKLPHYVGYGAKVALSLHSYLPMNLYTFFNDLRKISGDFVHSIRAHHWMGMMMTAIKVLSKVATILLVVSGTAAAFIGLFGAPAISLSLYQLMSPIAITALVVDILTQVADYLQNRQLLQQLALIDHQDRRIKELVDHFIGLQTATPAAPPAFLAVKTICQINRYTLEIKFKHKMKAIFPAWKQQKPVLTDEQYRKLFSELKECVAINQNMDKRQLILTAVGYIALFICKLYPETLLQSSIEWAMCLFWTINLIYTKCQHLK